MERSKAAVSERSDRIGFLESAARSTLGGAPQKASAVGAV